MRILKRIITMIIVASNWATEVASWSVGMPRRLLYNPQTCRTCATKLCVSSDGLDRRTLGTNLVRGLRNLLWMGSMMELVTPRRVIAASDTTEDDTQTNTLDLTQQLFNPDGSLKGQIDTTAKFRTVELAWNVDDITIPLIAMDGMNTIKSGQAGMGEATIKVLYQLPEKWSNSNDDNKGRYYDKEKGARACDFVTVYRPAGTSSMKRLEKASITGIAQALAVTDTLQDIRGADLIGGKASVREGKKYFDFDMALAPKQCESSTDNLGLGFCPYDTIYLLSSTVVNNQMYVFALKCNKEEWKRSNGDLRKVRSSFQVEEVQG